jgi:hypothetical protein
VNVLSVGLKEVQEVKDRGKPYYCALCGECQHVYEAQEHERRGGGEEEKEEGLGGIVFCVLAGEGRGRGP